MADETEEKGKSVSFTFSKKKTTTKLLQANKEYRNDDKETEFEKDFIHSAEGKVLKSIKPKDNAKELVIPCRTRNDVLLSKVQNASGNTLDKQAAEEIIKDLTNTEQVENDSESNFKIPLLARTHLATAGESSNTDNLTVLEDESKLEDYNAVPVTEFGAAMLRGMGWKKGEAIGGTNKGLTVPIEFIPRSQGLGLGAERRHEDDGKKRRRKPGDKKSSEKLGPIIEKNGKVRHFKGLDEKIPDQHSQEKTFSKGSYIVIESGPHRDLSAKIIAIDEDNARIIVNLAVNGEEITVSQHNVRLVDREEYKQFAKAEHLQSNKDRKTKRQLEDSERENSHHYSPKKHKSKHKKHSKEKNESTRTCKDNQSNQDYRSKEEPCWMAPLIRVRIIDKTFKNGKYYHKKVVIEDVVSQTTCVCRTDEGRLLEDVPQTALETVIPKIDPRFVLFVQGEHKGLVGQIMQTESSKQKAIVQMLKEKNIVKSHYDDICEFTGDINRD